MAAQTQNSASQSAHYPLVYKVPHFAFLVKPLQPAEKKRLASVAPHPPPVCSPPSLPVVRRRSSTLSRIATWATNVQPGTPAPWSPLRRASITSLCSRRPSVSRRPSITHSVPLASFLHLTSTPTVAQNTPSVAQIDLTALGYTSLFVYHPKTPGTASPHPRHAIPAGAFIGKATVSKPRSNKPLPPIPTGARRKTRKMKRFRPFTLLRSSKSKDQSPVPSPATPSFYCQSAKPTKTTFGNKQTSRARSHSFSGGSEKTSASAATIAKRKRAKYANVRPPPPLAAELAMMQFADGGNIDSHIKRVMEAQAKAAAGSGGSANMNALGVADVYRDAHGGIWWDADEEMEYAHLLDGLVDTVKAEREAEEMDWEDFTLLQRPVGKENVAPSSLQEDAGRRPSLASSIDSDFDPTYLLPLPENDAYPSFTSGPINDRVLTSSQVGGPGMSVLSLPARPRRRAMHLQKPGFLVDMGPFGPRSPATLTDPNAELYRGKSKPRGKARRRPAPLKLANSAHARANLKVPSITPLRKLPTSEIGSGGMDPVQVRREFIENSFTPAPSPLSTTTTPSLLTVDTARGSRSGKSMNSSKRSTSTLALRNLFTRASKAD